MKRFKMVLYGEPGVGKSVFACKAPKPFFITTDGNYEWLEDFGAKEKDHIQVYSWSEAKKAFKMDFSNYETIVIDLTEDLFKWCEYEYCKLNNLDHVSDIGYGKGYDITRNEFFIEICKLIGLDKNIIFIMHGVTVAVKDRKGIEHTHYVPSPRIPDKVLDMIEGRVRYFLRCYCKAETLSNGSIVKKRYLSLIPKENEFGIHRGVNESVLPQDIELDFNVFASTIGLSESKIEEEISKKIEVKEESQDKPKKAYHKRQLLEEEVIEKKEEVFSEKNQLPLIDLIEESKNSKEKNYEVKDVLSHNENNESNTENTQNANKEVKEETNAGKQEIKELSQQERIAAIKAKLALKHKLEE